MKELTDELQDAAIDYCLVADWFENLRDGAMLSLADQMDVFNRAEARLRRMGREIVKSYPAAMKAKLTESALKESRKHAPNDEMDLCDRRSDLAPDGGLLRSSASAPAPTSSQGSRG